MKTEVYVCFIRDENTGMDFTTVTRAPSDKHKLVRQKMAQKYRGSGYTVLTTATTGELQTTLADINRWCAITAA